MPQMAPPPVPHAPQPMGMHTHPHTPGHGVPIAPQAIPYPQASPQNAVERLAPAMPMQYPPAPPMYANTSQTTAPMAAKKATLIWWIVGLLVLGAAGGAVLALVMR
jgi:hypothetical protein